MTNPHRQPAGVPVGGQFASSQRASAGFTLAEAPRPATRYSVAEAEQLHEKVARLRMKSDRLARAEVCSGLSDLGISSFCISEPGDDGPDFIDQLVDTDGVELGWDDPRFDVATELAQQYPMTREGSEDIDAIVGAQDLGEAFADLAGELEATVSTAA